MQKEFIDDIVYDIIHNHQFSIDGLLNKRVFLLIDNSYVEKALLQVLYALQIETGAVIDQVEEITQADFVLELTTDLLRGRIPFGPSLPSETNLYQVIQEYVKNGHNFEELYVELKKQENQYVYIKDLILMIFENTLMNRISDISNNQFRSNLFLTYKSLTANKGELIFFDEQFDASLKKIQTLVLELILEIDRICKKYQIQYYLAGGTLLGAIRHGGFIPWDDDADLMMTRDEFDKFERVVQSELNPKYFWQTNETDSYTFYPYSKIRINHTRYSTGFTYGIKEMHQGIFVDIFVHDNTSNHKLFQKLHFLETKVFRGILVYKWTNQPMNKHPKIISAIADRVIKLIPIKFWYKMTINAIKKYKSLKNADYLYDGMGEHINNGCFPRQWLNKQKFMDFEGYSLPVPESYEEYLNFLYGNYKELIRISKRKAIHDIVDIDFGPYSDKGDKQC